VYDKALFKGNTQNYIYRQKVCLAHPFCNNNVTPSLFSMVYDVFLMAPPLPLQADEGMDDEEMQKMIATSTSK
jgi:hypothetical protein